MRVLVIGATGCAGKLLSERLVALGHEVCVFTRAPLGDGVLSGVSARFTGDLGDPDAIARAAAGCDSVFHCAGENSRHAPPSALSWIHVAGTENVVNAARHAGVRRVVLLSCADATLIDADRLSWSERAVMGQSALGAWARSKLLAEEVALQASDAKLGVCALRPGFVWGPGESTLAPELCRQARTGGVPLFGRGDNLVATIYIDNLVDALVAAAIAPDAPGQAFHVNDGEFLTAHEFFSMLCRALGLPGPRRGIRGLSMLAAWLRRGLGREGPWPEDVARRARGCLLDCLQAATLLGYQPRVGFEQGSAALERWAREVGGPSAIERMARAPATAVDAERMAKLADELAAAGSD